MGVGKGMGAAVFCMIGLTFLWALVLAAAEMPMMPRLDPKIIRVYTRYELRWCGDLPVFSEFTEIPPLRPSFPQRWRDSGQVPLGQDAQGLQDHPVAQELGGGV